MMFTHMLYIKNHDKDAAYFGLDDDGWGGNPFKSYQLTLYNLYLLATDGEFNADLYHTSETNRLLLVGFLFTIVVVMMNVM